MQASENIEVITAFSVCITAAFLVNLYYHNKTNPISISGAICWSGFWIILALVFSGYLWITVDKTAADLFLVGYILEKTLSFDNLFIFMAIFSSFRIQGILQRKILFWGILGAIVFRGIFVFLGTSLFKLSPTVELIFAIFIIFSAMKMLKNKYDNTDKPEDFYRHWSAVWLGKIIPIYPKLYQDNFFVSHKDLVANNLLEQVPRQGKFYLTPAFLCLIVIEISDIAFAFDSVPAIIAITNEPVLVYSAIIFAILGLRSLYFVLEILAKRLVYLEKSIIVLLIFIAVKMLLHFISQYWSTAKIEISPSQSLIIVASILGGAVLASLLAKK